MFRLFTAKIILFFFVLLVCDWIFLVPFRGMYFHPVLLYLIVLYAGFEWTPAQTVRLSLVTGFLRDGLGTQPLGVEMSVMLAATAALLFFVKKIDRNSLVMKLFSGFIFVFFIDFLSLVFCNLLGFARQQVWECFGTGIVTAFSTMIFSPLFFQLAGKIFRKDKDALRQYELFR